MVCKFGHLYQNSPIRVAFFIELMNPKILKPIILNLHRFWVICEKKSQPIYLILWTFVGSQYMVQTIQYSCTSGKHQDFKVLYLNSSRILRNCEKTQKIPNKAKTVGYTYPCENDDFDKHGNVFDMCNTCICKYAKPVFLLHAWKANNRLVFSIF